MSPDETALRTAVAADPDAALPRLVLADFLDDQNQPTLATALRLDVALSAERPWADRYWHLKAKQPPDFPADLGRLTDRQPLLCGVPDDWRSRWRAVRAFVSRWWDVPLGDIGRWGAAVEEAERVAGRELPQSVKEWAAFSTELATLDVGAFRDPLGFGSIAGAVTLLEQAEGDLFWTLPDEWLGEGDQSVHLTDADGECLFTPPELAVYSRSVAGFALFYLLSYRSAQLPESDYVYRRDERAASQQHAGRFDLADVYESQGHATVLLPPGTWGLETAQMFLLNDGGRVDADPS